MKNLEANFRKRPLRGVICNYLRFSVSHKRLVLTSRGGENFGLPEMQFQH
ncbi:hypothetical protein [uncultured Fibrobacter sp.]|nr:hypothetical protein [uncultured Fibrobacter sp.]